VTYLHLRLNAALLLFSTSAALSADAPAQLKGSDAKLSNPLAAQSIERLSAIVDRPLFSPSRRGVTTPPVNRAPETATPSPPPPTLVFSGAVLDGTSAHVVVLVGAERRALRAQIGDEIGGWKVSEISGRTLVLSRDGRFATFSLFKGNNDQRMSDDGAPSKGSANAPKALQQQQ
jgi:hypothetical protein